MDYFVIGADGKQYGPATLETLEQWAGEGRLTASSSLRDSTGQTLSAGSLLRTFASAPPVATAPPPSVPAGISNYNRPAQNWSTAPTYSSRTKDSGDWAIVFGVVGRSVLALVFFFLLHGIGAIVGSYALFYAIRAKIAGHRHGWLMIIIAAGALALVLVGWALRIGGSQGTF